MLRRSRASQAYLAVLWSLIEICFGVMASIVGPTASLLALQCNVTEADLAPVVGLGGIATLIGGMPSGWIMDLWEGQLLLGITLLVEALGFYVMPLCTHVYQLCIVYGIICLAFNAINTSINVMACREFDQPGSERALQLVLNLLSATFGVGAVLAPKLVIQLAGRGSYTAVAVSAAVFGLAALIYTGPPHPSSNKQPRQASGSGSQHRGAVCTLLEETGEDTCIAFTLDDGSPAAQPSRPGLYHQQQQQQQRSAEAPTGASEQAGSIGPGEQAPALVEVSSPEVKPIVLDVLVPSLVVLFSNVSIELGYAAWIFVYAKVVTGQTDIEAENTVSMYWLSFTLARIVAIPLASCMSSAAILLLTMPLAIAGSVWPLLVPGRVGTLASALLVGVGAAAGVPNTMAITNTYMTLTGTVNGMFSTVAGLSMTLMPSAIPILAKLDPGRGWTWLMILTLGMAVVQLVALLWLLAAGHARGQRDSHTRLPRQASTHNEDLSAPLLEHTD